jgi:hypothetical protein
VQQQFGGILFGNLLVRFSLPFFTAAGNLGPPISLVLHANTVDTSQPTHGDATVQLLRDCLVVCDKHVTACSLTVPIPCHDSSMDDPWSLAHAVAKAVQQFDADTSIAAGAV